MRIIGGTHRGRKLFFKKRINGLRPTKDRVRESCFNIMQQKCQKAHVLDCYAGTGAFGFEAISRGAASCTFVDIDIQYIQKNSQMFDKTQWEIHKKKVQDYIIHCTKRYDIIFMDPPWQDIEEYGLSLKKIEQFDILTQNGWIILEYPKKINIKLPELMNIYSKKHYGNTVLMILERSK